MHLQTGSNSRSSIDLIAPSVRSLADSWTRSLTAESKKPKTIQNYVDSVVQFTSFLEAAGMPTAVTDITREHVETFMADINTRMKPASAETRFRRLRSFFEWCVEDGEIQQSPMRNMKPPRIPEQPARVLTTEELAALFKACEGTGFRDRRDLALIRLYFDTGARLTEIANLRDRAVDWSAQTITVTGKGDRERTIHFGAKSSRELDRYLRVRRQHRLAAESEWLWFGSQGRFTYEGIKQMLQTRGRKAGIDGLHAHLFRHSNAHTWLAAGGSETGLMSLMGWRSSQMVRRYASSTAAERARDEHKRIAPGDSV